MSEARSSRVFLVICLIGLTIGSRMVFAQKENRTPAAKKISFVNGKWEDVAALAKKNGKYIFVDAYTAWCTPCRQLKEVTFKDKEAAEFYNGNFINYMVDMEKGEGEELAEKWDVTVYPTLLYFTPEGKMVMKQVGYVDGQQLIEFGKQALAGK
ncbi:thiol reductase thioredoxin [Niastella yeongjuensis]|uniref:Thiol reductase thioredoxin n=1 Tax=Niastella yeongjuensis TaxID=354355 RepID=A0A1V9EGK3_9BACT|nr:thioredoxin family protein [Niastella yeongjuensis]OQP45260.1 thiol reductase thioredoxin [Niastella yeongjuensis]SEO28031.1 Thioredoxin-like domain-containing protein [Niastella yeongjuensis]